MNVLSLFNGCGMLRPALDKAGISVNHYYSSEIDKWANQIASKNYPDTIQLGDIHGWQSWDLEPIDLLTAGFPCQDLSCAGKQKGLNGQRSGLLYEALKIRDTLKPKYFLFENVASMSHYWRDEITKLVGVEPIKLNSKYWGAQSRNRLFWTNIPGAKDIEQNQIKNDKKIYLKDVLLDTFDEIVNCVDKVDVLLNKNPSGKGMSGRLLSPFGKSATLTKARGEGLWIADFNSLFIHSNKDLKIIRTTKKKGGDRIVKLAEIGGNSQGQRVYCRNGKSQTLSASGGGLGARTGLIFAYKNQAETDKSTVVGIRKLHPIECERLMNLPDNYTEGVSKTQRYMMIGNGWDVDVIAEFLNKLKNHLKRE